MAVLEVSTADQYLVATGDTTLLEVWKALPQGLFPPFPPVELPGALDGLLKRGGFAQTFFLGSEVLGLKFKSPKGHTVMAGGRVVKNVQGYDLVRPFVGSFGALGEVLEATLRLRPGRVWVFLRHKGELAEPVIKPRFLWQHLEYTYAYHFGHPLEIKHFAATFAGEEVREQQDYTALFPHGMGIGAGHLMDLRFSWADGGAKPPMPQAFKCLAETL